MPRSCQAWPKRFSSGLGDRAAHGPGRPRPRRKPRLGMLRFPRRSEDPAARRRCGSCSSRRPPGSLLVARRRPRLRRAAAGRPRGAVRRRRRRRRAGRLRRALPRARGRHDERGGADLGDGRAAADRRRRSRPAWRRPTSQGIGMALALAGAALASIEFGQSGSGRRAAAGVGLAVVAALGFGAFFVGTDLAADDGALWAVTINRAAAVAVLVAIVLALRRPSPLDARHDRAARRRRGARHLGQRRCSRSRSRSAWPRPSRCSARSTRSPRSCSPARSCTSSSRSSQRGGVAAALAGIGLVSLA